VVDIIPPLDSEYRITRVSGAIDLDDDLEFRPQPRATITGNVLSPDGEAISNATIEAILVKAAFADPRLARINDIAPPRTQRVQTSSSGAYVLQLDPGSHKIRVTPPAKSGLPNAELQLEITALDTTVPDVDILLSPAAGLKIGVVDSRDIPIRGTVVEAWRTDEMPPRHMGRGRTGPDGTVTLRLPVIP